MLSLLLACSIAFLLAVLSALSSLSVALVASDYVELPTFINMR